MDDEWINKVVYVRTNIAGDTDRGYLGVQLIDDSLAWIELTLAAPAPANEANEPPPPPVSGTVTYQRKLFEYTTASANSWRGIDKYSMAQLSAFGFLVNTDTRYEFYRQSTGARGLQGGVVATGILSGVTGRADGNRFAVADSTFGASTARVRIYTTVTAPPSIDKSINLGGAYTIRDICYSASGGVSTYIYVADVSNGLLKRINVSTEALASSKSVAGIAGIAIVNDTDGVYYTSQSTNTVNKIAADLSGAVIWSTGGSGTGNGQFNTPSGLTVVDGRVWVVDKGNSRVQAFRSSDGVYLGQFGTAGTSNDTATLENPWDISNYHPSGTAYLYVYEGGISSPLVTSHVSEWLIASDFPT